MVLHRYLIRFTSRKVVTTMNRGNEPYTQADLEDYAKARQLLFEKEVHAFNASDALIQLRVSEGGSMDQPPYVFAIDPLPDTPSVFAPDNLELEDEAMCAICGKVATRWQKDIPVCADAECRQRAATMHSPATVQHWKNHGLVPSVNQAGQIELSPDPDRLKALRPPPKK